MNDPKEGKNNSSYHVSYSLVLRGQDYGTGFVEETSYNGFKHFLVHCLHSCFLTFTTSVDEVLSLKNKGQIILKDLFGIIEFSQETNEQILCSSKNEFVRSFFGRIRGD